MKRIALVLVAVAMVGVVAVWAQNSTGADAEPAPRSAKEVRGASPYIGVKDEPPHTLPAYILGSVRIRDKPC